jgi:excinuclease ABC subunit B
MSVFKLVTDKKPAGGQPEAIKKLVAGYPKYERQTLLGITGSGKTFMMANVIEQLGKPTLVVAHNKTLAAQLYAELKELFPHNRVEYFVSYFDYYQPESYLPSTDTYIEKDSRVNPQIERMRLMSMTSLLSRSDVIIVASISCIYGLGNPVDFKKLSVPIKVGMHITRDQLLRKFVDMQYERNDQVLESGKFRVRGDVIDVFPAYDERIVRIELFGDDVEKISEIDPLNFTTINEHTEYTLFPAKQFVTTEEKIEKALNGIEQELDDTLPKLDLLERTRLEKRTKYDLALIREIGYCNGIENYSRYFDGRDAGMPPYTLLDFFPEDFLFIIDESHQTIPQMHAMYKGDVSRKANLVEHGFRLPCAYDNRPLKFEETEHYFRHVFFVSATPSAYEKETSGQLVEAIIRPTGLLDPLVEVRPSKGQITDLIEEVKATTKRGWRVLITTLTKKMAEDLTNHLGKEQLKVRYLHSEIDTLERTEIIRELRLGTFDILVGINLLREGLDIPEVALVAILDADKEGFLRNESSLLQTIGRAARNAEGRVIFYADRTTPSMTGAIEKTAQRRATQEAFNKKHGIVPKTIIKAVPEKKVDIKSTKHLPKSDIPNAIIELEAQMGEAAANLDFEQAIQLRERIKQLERELGADVHVVADD